LKAVVEGDSDPASWQAAVCGRPWDLKQMKMGLPGISSFPHPGEEYFFVKAV